MPSRSRKEKVRSLWLARDQFARYLHDGPAQSIAAIAMRLNIAKRLVDKDAAKAINELDQAEEQTRRVSKEMRYLLFTTQAKSLRSSGLVIALQDLAEQTEQTFGKQVHLNVNPKSGKGISADRQSLLFFIAVEAVTTARKHEGVENIWLRLQQVEKGLLLLEVYDDGQDFINPANVKANLPADDNDADPLKDLIDLVEGKLEIAKEEDGKSRLQIWTPLNENVAERLRHEA